MCRTPHQRVMCSMHSPITRCQSGLGYSTLSRPPNLCTSEPQSSASGTSPPPQAAAETVRRSRLRHAMRCGSGMAISLRPPADLPAHSVLFNSPGLSELNWITTCPKARTSCVSRLWVFSRSTMVLSHLPGPSAGQTCCSHGGATGGFSKRFWHQRNDHLCNIEAREPAHPRRRRVVIHDDPRRPFRY